MNTAFRGAGAALKLHLAQSVANALWSWLFFAWHLGAIAFAEIVVLPVLIAATIITFWRFIALQPSCWCRTWRGPALRLP